MTRDEILKMKYGPELDALVAEKIFGMKVMIAKNPAFVQEIMMANIWIDKQKGGHPQTVGMDGSAGWYPCPEFSKDISAAWKVVEEMIYLGWWFNLAYDEGDIYKICFWKGEPKGWFPTVENHSKGENPSLPICRSALLAVSEGKP
jgi:hypothetical protein